MTDAEVLAYFVFIIVVAFVVTPLLLGGAFHAFSTQNPAPWSVLRTYAVTLTIFSLFIDGRSGAMHLWVRAIGMAIVCVLAVVVRNRLTRHDERKRNPDPPAIRDVERDARGLARHFPLTD